MLVAKVRDFATKEAKREGKPYKLFRNFLKFKMIKC